MSLSLIIFGSYLACVVFLIAQTAHQWLPGNNQKHKVLAFLSLGLTWERMFRYFAWSFRNYHKHADIRITRDHVAQWLSSTSLFKEAWQLVVSSPEARLITQRVCFATILWTVFLHKYRDIVPHTYVYMLLGQTVAISFAMNLYFSALTNREPQDLRVNEAHSDERTAGFPPQKYSHFTTSTLLVPCVFVAILSTLSMYTLPERFFLQNLLVLHGILLIPLLVRERNTRAPRYLNIVLAITSFMCTVLSWSKCTSVSEFLRIIGSNPAIGSIAGDAFMIVLSIFLWNGQSSHWGLLDLLATTLTPLWQAPIGDV